MDQADVDLLFGQWYEQRHRQPTGYYYLFGFCYSVPTSIMTVTPRSCRLHSLTSLQWALRLALLNLASPNLLLSGYA